MKTLTIGFFALLASANLFAQEPAATNEPQKQEATVQNAQQDGLTLMDHKVWLYENGQAKAIIEEIWTQNGMKVTPSGTLVFANGDRAKLQTGDFVSMTGAVARPIPIKGSEVVMTKK